MQETEHNIPSSDKFVSVVLPLALPMLYSYSIPPELEGRVAVGKRVEVQFGKRRIYAALVRGFTASIKDVRQVKPVLSVLDDHPIVQEWQFQFWEWIAAYYMCTLGEVMQAALPAAFKLDSESSFMKNPYAEYDTAELSDDEFLVVEAFDFQQQLKLEDVQSILSRKSVFPMIRSLIDRRILYIHEELVERYKPRMRTFAELSPEFKEESAIRKLMYDLQRAPKQLSIIIAYLDRKFRDELPVSKSDLLEQAGAGSGAYKALEDKGVLRSVNIAVDRLEDPESGNEANRLEPEQQHALTSVSHSLEKGRVTLLHGVTSSGKTHVYVELIKRAAASGKQVLFLLPEIGLTAQLIRRLRRWLGDIGVYHSKFSDAERIEIWNKVQDGRYKVVVGARSALLLPFRSLGLIIVDEEHDISYKQFDPAPRYQARDAAIYLARSLGAGVLLGSATPSFESYYNAMAGKYDVCRLDKRYGGIQLPAMEIADLSAARKNRSLQGSLTPQLAESIREVLKSKGQVILFQNRRGYAPYLACPSCNWIPLCRDCDVSLTYHKFTSDLRCHYCGYREPAVHVCGACGTAGMDLRGAGTEKVEDELKELFPEAAVARMDWDSVRTRHAHDRIIERLEDGRIDILVGTQMVTKGLDFENVKLVGVLNADGLLYFPDFRSLERACQLIFQVSGRAGRKGSRGKVVVQMSDTRHPLTSYIRDDRGYERLFREELLERKEYRYPPYTRLLRIVIRHRESQVSEQAAADMAAHLRSRWGKRVIGPVKPVISRIRTLYIREITIKMEKAAETVDQIKTSISEVRREMDQYERYRSLRIHIDVDPY